MKNKIHDRVRGLYYWLRIILPAAACMLLFQATPSLAQIPDGYRPVYEEAVAAGIPTDRLNAFLERAHNRQLSPEELDKMVRPAISLAQKDLPYQPIIQKAMEGMAKQVPPTAIQQVLGQMENGFIRSAELVDPWLARQEVRSMIESGRGSRDMNVTARAYREMVLENTSYALQLNVREEAIRGVIIRKVGKKIIFAFPPASVIYTMILGQSIQPG